MQASIELQGYRQHNAEIMRKTFLNYHGLNKYGSGGFFVLSTQKSVQLYLDPDHRADLKKSGLTEETIAAAGIRTIPLGDIDKVIGYSITEINSAYRIPFGDGFERAKVFYRRDATPPKGKKFRKYHQKADTGNRLYIPPMIDPAALRDTSKAVHVIEGEKKALSAVQAGYVAVAITGLWNWKRKGTDELIRDFQKITLKDRKVILVPDSDWRDPKKNLKQAVERFARALQIAGARVSILNLPVEGDEKVGLDDYLVKHGVESFARLAPEVFPIMPFSRMERDGLKYYDVETEPIFDGNGKKIGSYEKYKAPVKIADALEILNYVHNGENCDWGKLLRFMDKRGNMHRWVMAFDMICRDGEAMRKELLNQGLSIHSFPKYRHIFNQYLQETEPEQEETLLCTSRTGWDNNCFVLPNRTIGDDEASIIYQGFNKSVLDSKGTLAAWIETIGKMCVGNSRLIFAVSLAFAATFIEICGKENGGFHMRGNSTTGKSTILYVAVSVWGSPGYKLQWKATINGLEAIAEEHNDLLIVLDEISEADPKTVGNTAYMLANGQGKIRAKETGNARKTKSFRLFTLSSGEESLADVMRGEGKRIKAGQEIRLCDIPAKVGPYGVFEDIHGCEGGSEFSTKLTEAARENYGHAGIAFIEKTIEVRHEIPATVKNYERQFEQMLPPGCDGQVIRVAKRFAMVAAAGELATDWGLTGWPKGHATTSSMSCLKDWITARGGVMPHEIKEVLGHVRYFFETQGPSRFQDWEYPSQILHNRAGFRKKTDDDTYEYFVSVETFRKDICDRFDVHFVTSLLMERDVLISGKGHPTKNVRLPGQGPTRCYHITSKVYEVEP